MKYLLLFILVIHGLIHSMGFVKAFNLAALEQLREPITRPVGLLWLGAAVLFLASAVLLLVAPDWWWLLTAGAVVLSQGVIIASWSDAKFGTIANVLVLVPVVVAGLGQAPWSFRAQYARDTAVGLANPPAQVDSVTEADIAHLPVVVQRYLYFVGAVGKPRVWNYRLRFGGALRNDRDSAWMPMVVDQQSFVDPPARLFIAELSISGLPAMTYHRYVGPAATFEVTVASLLKVVDARGPEMNQSETVTLFNDMCLLAPATLIDPRITWEEIDPQTVRATYTNASNTISAILTFDATGAMTNFVSDDRSRTLDGTHYERLRWSTPISAWRTIDGRKLPVDGEAIWDHPSGAFAYGRFKLLTIEYN
ncbi:MAG: DUF6544 family protein, partial [Chloroflexales bacterium]